MRTLVTGSRGMIGSELVRMLLANGHDVVRLVRSRPQPEEDEFHWDPEAGRLDRAALEGVEAVVHLAGESLAGRWTRRKKARILDSRVKGTRLLSEAIAERERPPKTLISASAVGYYGDRGDEQLMERSPQGEGFLADVAGKWEAATAPAAGAGIRVVNLRFGIVLARTGGALARLLTPFRVGLGGRFGSGRQYMSWVHIDDALGAIRTALSDEQLTGPVNMVAPNPVTNAEFTKTLGEVLGRPAVVRVPASAARLLIGEFAEESLLSSTRALPERLLTSGYRFRQPELERAFRHLLAD